MTKEQYDKAGDLLQQIRYLETSLDIVSSAIINKTVKDASLLIIKAALQQDIEGLKKQFAVL